ncbi:MAG: hypothetical protein ACK4G1_06675, partial [Ignavibacteria bacterium]
MKQNKFKLNYFLIFGIILFYGFFTIEEKNPAISISNFNYYDLITTNEESNSLLSNLHNYDWFNTSTKNLFNIEQTNKINSSNDKNLLYGFTQVTYSDTNDNDEKIKIDEEL